MNQLSKYIALLAVLVSLQPLAAEQPLLESQLVFPLRSEHNHAPSIVELPDGSFLASWYRGSGERKADDVAVYGARLAKGSKEWSPDFLMTDTPGFPD
jgi:predicted neuraminidase